MWCPGCGRPVKEDVRFCPACGRPIGDGVAINPPSPLAQSKAISPALIAVIVVIVIAVVVVGIVALALLASSTHDLRADMSYRAQYFSLELGSSGLVDVWGNVYNYGSNACLATLELRIFDGYDWHEYTESLGRIPGNGGYVSFEKRYFFNSMNDDAVQVKYWLIGE